MHGTAKKAFLMGWNKPDWARSIKAVLEEEQAKLRASLYEEERIKHETAAQLRIARETAELDAKSEKLREAQAVRYALSSAIGALAVSGQLAQAKAHLALRAGEQIVQEASQGKMTWPIAMQLLGKLQHIDSQATNQLKTSMEVLRLHLGEPEKFLAVTGHSTEALTTVDGRRASEALGGEENLRQALHDLADDKITPLVERLIEFQIETANQKGNS